MSGTKTGGLKARETNLKKYGKEFYRLIGSKGGQQNPSRPRGFAANPELARRVGTLGGKKSRRTGVATGQGRIKEYVWKGGPNETLAFKEK